MSKLFLKKIQEGSGPGAEMRLLSMFYRGSLLGIAVAY